jgi:stress response protein SCP2
MTIDLTKGANALISASAQDAIIITVTWNAPSAYEVDASAFMLNEQNRVLNDDAMIFFNQPASPDQALHYHADKRLFTLALTKLAPAVQKITFTLTLYQGNERGQQFKQVASAVIRIIKDTQALVCYEVSGKELNQETALIIGELYLHKGQWKFKAIGQGFNGGLAALCHHYGVSVAEDESTTPTLPPASHNDKLISLEKKLQHAPVLLSLAKQAHVALEKVKLTEHKAKVALCLDISASMGKLYRTGKIQQLAEKVLALACQFNEVAEIEVFLFGEKAHHPAAIDVNNFTGFTQRLLNRYPLEGGTCYGKVMKLIRNFYFPPEITVNKPLLTTADLPVYVMFVTDGNTSDAEETKRQVKGSSYEPIFWQFMAIGKTKKSFKNKSFLSSLFVSDFTFLEALDVLPERYIDNANFFSVEDPEEISDTELYNLLMAEYPHWLQLATQHAMLNPPLTPL